MASKIVIVGYGTSYRDCPWDLEDAEYWGINSLYETLPDKPWSRWFHMHKRAEITPADVDWMTRFGNHAYVLGDHIGIPGASTFPRKAVEDFFAPYSLYNKGKEDYWTSSMAWMLGFAIMLEPDEIQMYGVDLTSNVEYREQRACVEGLIRFFQGRGGKFVLPQTCGLFKTAWVYGYEEPNYTDLEKTHTMLRERLRTTQAVFEKKQAEMNQLHGARLELRHQIQMCLMRMREAGKDPGPTALGDYNDDLDGIALGE